MNESIQILAKFLLAAICVVVFGIMMAKLDPHTRVKWDGDKNGDEE
jgi:uncharacterized membrane protein YjfL (UPF0719 family)